MAEKKSSSNSSLVGERKSSRITESERKKSNSSNSSNSSVGKERLSRKSSAELVKKVNEEPQDNLSMDVADADTPMSLEEPESFQYIQTQIQKLVEDSGDNTDILKHFTHNDDIEAKTEDKNETNIDENTETKPEQGAEKKMYSTRTTIEIVPKHTITETTVTETITTNIVSKENYNDNDVKENDSETTIEIQTMDDDSRKSSVMELSEDSISRKTSYQEDELEEGSVSKKHSVAEAISEDVSMKSLDADEVCVNNQDQDAVKVAATENNQSSDEDNVDDDDDDDSTGNDNDSVEGDDIQNLPPMFGANKPRKISEAADNTRRFSQKFINPFEPPCPELVDKTALIAEFENVQEQNLKNNTNNYKLDSSQGSQYFTSQALNNATSASINHVSRSISVQKSLVTKSFIKLFWQINAF